MYMYVLIHTYMYINMYTSVWRYIYIHMAKYLCFFVDSCWLEGGLLLFIDDWNKKHKHIEFKTSTKGFNDHWKSRKQSRFSE
jgi:hypothetical protein